jgi:hypothetical protein
MAIDLRDTIVTEVALSQRIIRKGIEVVPRFTIFAPDGTHTAMVELAVDPIARLEQLHVMRNFMIYKAAHAFVLANELIEPNAISVIAVARSDVIGSLQRIHRDPVRFDPLEWFGRESVGNEVIDFLPPRELAVTHEDLSFMRQAFEKGSVAGVTWLRNGDDDWNAG